MESWTPGESDADVSNVLEDQQGLSLIHNPFLNHVVLRRFFELCDPEEDLPRFRLVSKLWNSESLIVCRRDMVVKIKHSATGGPDKFAIWKELRDHMSAGERPFRSFRLYNFVDFNFVPTLPPNPPEENDDQEDYLERDRHRHFSEKVAEIAENVKAFWISNGPWIRKLELYSCTISSMDSFKKLVFEGTPNLQELYLNSMQPEGWDSHLEPLDLDGDIEYIQSRLLHLRIKITTKLNCFPTTWRCLLLHFPNLQDFSLEICGLHFSTWDGPGGQWAMRNEMNIWHALLLICEERERSRLMIPIAINFKNSFFSLRLPVTERPLEEDEEDRISIPDDMNKIFRVLKPKLTSPVIALDIQNLRDEEMELLSHFLQFGGETMEKFSLKVARVFGSELNPIPDFPFEMGPFCSVTRLHLKGYICKNLHFLEDFPNLVNLRLEITRSDEMLMGTNLPRMTYLRLLKLKKFTYVDDFPQVPIPEEVMTLFISIMPNVEVFEAPLTNVLLRMVCRDWTQLLELHTDCDKMRFEDKINDDFLTGIVAEGEDRLPNITDLKNLTYLSILNMGQAGDFSLKEAFLKMHHLKSLNVDLDETSYESFYTLVNRFPLGKITRYHPGRDPERARKKLRTL